MNEMITSDFFTPTVQLIRGGFGGKNMPKYNIEKLMPLRTDRNK